MKEYELAKDKAMEKTLIKLLDRNSINRASQFGATIWLACDNLYSEISQIAYRSEYKSKQLLDENMELMKRVKDLKHKLSIENKSHNYHCKENQRKNDVIDKLESTLRKILKVCEENSKLEYWELEETAELIAKTLKN